jgi:hypothetical protein
MLAKEMRIYDDRPVHGDPGLPGARLLAKGDPERSVRLYRMAPGGRGHMPSLGGHLNRASKPYASRRQKFP